MNKIINYRWDFNGRKTAYVQMVGNPVNWGLGVVGILAAAVLILRRRALRHPKTEDAGTEDADMDLLEVLFAMFILFWGLHIYLGSQRVMYIYHYFIGLGLSYFLVALAFKVVSQRVAFVAKHRFSILCATSIAIAGSFLFYSPLTYHYFLSRKECQMRNWPVTLVICQPIKTKPAATSVSTTSPGA
jgi:dolichyl-phosphate-mannose--protein O-mannosyl transferase